MRALPWHGKGDIGCDTVPYSTIQHGQDAIINVTACAICGSDLHLMGGFVPTMESGDVLGHECMGEIVEVGRDIAKLKVGDRVVVPFTICCGECRQCKWGNWACCERTNPNGKMQAEQYGYPLAGLFGFSHITGVFRAGRPSISACPMPTLARSRCRQAYRTRRSCSCPTSSRLRSWPPTTARSSRRIRSPSGAAARGVAGDKVLPDAGGASGHLD